MMRETIRLLSWSFGACFFKSVDEFTITPRNLGNGGFARGSLLPPFDEGFPEVGAPDSEADEAWHGSRSGQPFAHLIVVFAPAQNDATDFIAPSAASSSP